MFIRNNEIHNKNTRNRTTLHVSIGTTETTYATFRFHGIYIRNLIFERIPTYVSYSCFKHILIDIFKHMNSIIGYVHIRTWMSVYVCLLVCFVLF